MAYEFKKLNDVNVIESTNENAHVLAEQDGEIVRIPASSVGGGLPSGGAPHQQLVTGADGVAKWEDKLFGEAIGEVERVFTDLEWSYSLAKLKDFWLEEGVTYTVDYDGKEYVGTAQYNDDGGLEVVFEYNEDGDKSFAIINFSNPDACALVDSRTGTLVYEVRIRYMGKTIKTIDPKYLPSVGGGGFMRIDISTNEDESEFYANVSGVAITEALNNGIMPYCVLAGMVVPLQSSPALSPVSALAAAPMHEFSGIQIGGTGNSFVIKCEIDTVESDVPCRAHISMYNIAPDVLELVT